MKRLAPRPRACSSRSARSAFAMPCPRHSGATRIPPRQLPSEDAHIPPSLTVPWPTISPWRSTTMARRFGCGLVRKNARTPAGDSQRAAFANLEPCAHTGRTPPCVDAVKQAGIARVVAAMKDPDPRTNGRGFRALRDAGIAIEEGLLREEAMRLNEGFISRVTRGRPFVLLKLATTLDGRVAVPGRRYLSGKRALREVHRLRHRSDAVIVGIGTILADDPALTVREVKGRDPLRVILDTEARTPPHAKIVRAADPQRTVIFVARDAEVRRTNRLRDAGVLLATLPRADGGLDLGAALRWLGEHGVNTVLSEGGPRIARSLVRGGFADRLLLLVSPLAGGDGPPALAGVGSPNALP